MKKWERGGEGAQTNGQKKLFKHIDNQGPEPYYGLGLLKDRIERKIEKRVKRSGLGDLKDEIDQERAERRDRDRDRDRTRDRSRERRR